MNKHIDLSHHFCLRNTKKVSKLVSPLTNLFDIKYFRYLRLFPDKTRIILTNFADCIRFIYEEGHYSKMWFEGEFPAYLGSGFNIWKAANVEEKTSFEEEINHQLGLHNGITYVNQCHGYWELFTFDTATSHIHNLDRNLLIHFMLYFKQQAHQLIQQGNNERIILPSFAQDNNNEELKAENLECFLANTNINRYYLNCNTTETYLTKKEALCIYWLSQGKTAEEIAIIEKNSKKTIEHHIENIKIKLNCSKLTQVFTIINSSGIFESLYLNKNTK